MNSSSRIVVIGSSNTDMVVGTSRLPGPGETVLGGQFFMNPGGKGANQAVAAARLGGSVSFIAKTGNDLFGRQSVENFSSEGLDTSWVLTDKELPSGVALITVDERGENCIVVAPGANAGLLPADLDRAQDLIQAASVVLVQLEIPIETVARAAGISAASGSIFILNPAPAQNLPDDLLARVSIITPNEKEASLLTGIQVSDADSALQAARKLRARGVQSVIITLGAEGALLLDQQESLMVPAPYVKAVDTTAAGDVFNGALAVALAEGKRLPDAVAFANAAASVSVTRPGAQSSAPFRKEILV